MVHIKREKSLTDFTWRGQEFRTQESWGVKTRMSMVQLG